MAKRELGSFHSTRIPVKVPEGTLLCPGVYGHADEKSQGLVAVEGHQQGFRGRNRGRRSLQPFLRSVDLRSAARLGEGWSTDVQS